MAALLFAAAAATQQVPTFESQVEAVYVDVLAERGGKLLEGLDASAFEVRDDGVVQRASVVLRENTNLHAVLALDVSGSVAGQRLSDLKAAAHAFLAGLGESDRVSLVAFNHGARLVGGSAMAPAEVGAVLDGILSGGGTALYDATLTGLVLADPRAGRPVLLVFSDGENRLSWTTSAGVTDAARGSDAVVYGVGAGSLESGGRKFLNELAQASGGRVWQARDGAELRAAFAQLLAELRGRYLLRYEPTSATPGWHPLEIKLRVPGEVRARRGYLRR